MRDLLAGASVNPALQFGALVVLSALFLFIASPYTSPSNPCYMGDSSVYFVMGKGLLQGMIPYKDLFDHKGILLYFIYAVGEWVATGKYGVFFVQTLNLSVALWALYQMGRLYLSRGGTWCLLLLFLLLLAGCMGGGGLAEEWSLSWSMAALYLVIRYVRGSHSATEMPGWLWVFLGVSFGVHFLLKATNASTTCGLVLALSVMLLREGALAAFFRSALLFCLGVACVLLPCLGFLWWTDSFRDGVYSYLEFNSAYAVNGAVHKGGQELTSMLMKFSSLPFLLGGGLLLWKRGALSGRVLVCVFAVAGCGALFLIPGNDYHNYYTSFLPTLACFLLVGLKLLSLSSGWRMPATVLLVMGGTCISFLAVSVNLLMVGLCAFLLPHSPAVVKQPFHSGMMFKAIYEQSGGGSLICCGPPSSIYLYMGVLPGHKYFFRPPFLPIIAPQMEEEIEAYFEGEAGPDWIVIPHTSESEEEEISHVEGAKTRRYLMERCERVACGEAIKSCVGSGQGADVYSLYRRVR